MQIGVVGGGIAGLTAAYRLSKEGHIVTVFEKDEKLGGLAQSIDFAGTKIDKFYRHIFKSDFDIVDLISELKLENEMDWVQTKMGFRSGGVNYSFSTPIDLIKFKPLPFFDRIKQGLMVLYLQNVKNWKKYEGITAKDWVIKYWGKNLYNVIWGPLLKQKFGDLAETISMTWLYGRIHSRALSREKGGSKEVLGYMKGSYQVLIDTLESEIIKGGGKIITSTPIEKVIVENNKVTGIQAKGETHSFDSVVLTFSPMLASKFVEWDKDFSEQLAKLKYYGAMDLVMTMKKSLSKYYWMNVAEEDSPFVATIEHTNFIPKEVYGDNHVMYISRYLSPEHPLFKASAEEVKEKFFDYLKKVFDTFDENNVIEWKVFREPFAQPVVQTKYSEIKPPYKTPVDGIFFASMSHIYPEDRGMSYSVKIGNEVAKEMIKYQVKR